MAAGFLCACLRLLNGSTLYTAAPNPRARANGITVSPVPSPRGREGRREGGGSRTPLATNPIPESLCHPHHLPCQGHLPPGYREESFPQVLQGPTWMYPLWARRKHVPNPHASGPSQERWQPRVEGARVGKKDNGSPALPHVPCNPRQGPAPPGLSFSTYPMKKNKTDIPSRSSWQSKYL